MLDHPPSKLYYSITHRDGSPLTLTSNNSCSNQDSIDENDHEDNDDENDHDCGDNNNDDNNSLVMAEKNRQRAIRLFSLTTILLFADQNLMSPNLTAVAEEYDFDDEERDTKLGGHIALAFWVLGAPAALLVGILADSMNRSVLFAWTVGIGEGACFLTFFTTTYWELFICRAITGFSIGGALPLIYSILGDMFAADERHKVNAMVGIGTGLGISVGQGIAGFLGPSFGWRLPFLVVSIPALFCAAMVFFTVQDPERGGMEQVVLEHKRGGSGGGIHGGGGGMDSESTSSSHSHIDNHHHLTQSELEMQKLKPTIDGNTIVANDCDAMSRSSSHDISSISPSLGVRKRSKGDAAPEKNQQCDDSFCEKGPLRMAAKNGPFRLMFRQHIEPTIKSLKVLLKTPTVVLALLQGAPGCLPWGIVNTYLNDFLAEDRSMSVEWATFTVLWFGAGNFFGLLIGGAGGQYLYRTDRRYPALLAGSMAIFGCVPFWVLLNGVNNSTPFLYIVAISLVAGIASGITGPIIKATLQNVTLPTMRGQAFAFFNTFDDFGRGLGPVFVAYLIKTVGGRTPAFNLGTLGWVVCGIFNLAIFFTADADEAGVQATLSASLR